MPDFTYNSILITRYNDGSDFIGFHSDNELEIVPKSKILTLSFGGTRVIEFKSNTNSMHNQTTFVRHGDAFVMSQESQNLFKHSIPADNSIEPRISITFRLLQNENSPVNNHAVINNTSLLSPIETGGPTQQSPTLNSHEIVSGSNPSITVYISDSMLRGVEASKMSSPTQSAVVLTYPGATAGGILNRLKRDPEFIKIDKQKVKQYFVMCGTNYVDSILRIPRSEQCNFVNNMQSPVLSLDKAKSEFCQLVHFLHTGSVAATINMLNILPRVSQIRNHVINELNGHISYLCQTYTNTRMIGTEYNRNLFSFTDGTRKNFFFSNRGSDNVHLNRIGILRIAKHLKYLAHN